MTSRRRLGVLGAALLALVGCRCDPPPETCTGVSLPGPTQVAAVVPYGASVALELSQPTKICGLIPSSVSVHVELFDGNGDAVDSQLDAPSYFPTDGVATTVLRFQPSHPGLYRALVSFEPTLGRVKVEVVVALKGSLDGGMRVELPVSASSCSNPGLTSSGAVVCQMFDGAHVYRNGLEVDHFTTQNIQVQGRHVWSSDQQSVTHRSDLGAGALMVDGTLSLSSEFFGFNGSFAAGNSIWVNEGERVSQVSMTDAGLTRAQAGFFLGSANSNRQVIVDRGEVMVFVPCFGPVIASCPTVVGYGAEGLWISDTFNSNRLSLRDRPFQDGGATLSLDGPQGWVVRALGVAAPISTSARPVLTNFDGTSGSLVPVQLPDGQWTFVLYAGLFAQWSMNGTVLVNDPLSPGVLWFLPAP